MAPALSSLGSLRTCVPLQRLLQDQLFSLHVRNASFANHDRVEYRNSNNRGYLSGSSSERERTRTVSAYYNQPAVDAAACKVNISMDNDTSR